MRDVERILEEIRQEHNGILRPEDVIKRAQDPESPLHERFQWDDTEAAYQYRLYQARQLIRVCVKVVAEADEDKPLRVYVSLLPDRRQEGGGYRTLEDVLESADLREQLLEQATHDFRRWEEKYRRLQELAQVFAAMRRVQKELDQGKPAKRESAANIAAVS